jgi:hypothetical protein
MGVENFDNLRHAFCSHLKEGLARSALIRLKGPAQRGVEGTCLGECPDCPAVKTGDPLRPKIEVTDPKTWYFGGPVRFKPIVSIEESAAQETEKSL